MRLIQSMGIAFALYSRIPMPQIPWSEENRRLALCFLPLVGAAVGGAVGLWLWLCARWSLPPAVCGAVAAALPVWITGGIHMDGFLDTSDALASWQGREKKLEILRDSHVGSGAVTACGVYLLLSAALLGSIPAGDIPALALCFVASRALCAWMSGALPGARPGGMLDRVVRPSGRRAVTAAGVSVLVLCAAAWALLLGWGALAPVLAAGFCAAGYRKMAMTQFGGVTGDLAGWLIQVSELCLIAAVWIGGMCP